MLKRAATSRSSNKVRPSRSHAGPYRGFPRLSLFSKKSANFATSCEPRRDLLLFLFDWKCLDRGHLPDHTRREPSSLPTGCLSFFFSIYYLVCVLVHEYHCTS